MKKIISLILAITILMGISVNFVSAETVSFSDAEKFAIALGVVDEATYNPNGLVSRAEYAEIIARLCMLKTETDNYDDWYNRVFGEDNKDEQIEATASSVFADVDQSLPQCEAINIVYSYGYMKGLTGTHFGPNYDITFAAVAKVLVHMAGYGPIAERNGGYPGGYMAVAGNLGITKGISASANSFVTFKQCIEMLYKVIDVKMMELSYVEDDGYGALGVTDETFLTSVLGLFRIDARVEDNGITSIYGNSQIGSSTIKIGGVVMDATNCDYARSYLGKNVAAFYKKVDGNYQLIYAFPVKNTELTIQAKDFISFDGSSITYYDETGKAKSSDVNAPKLIYNNKALTTYTAADFDFTYGDITLVSTNNSSAYDLIVVRDYMVGRVKKVNTDIEALYVETHYQTMSSIKTLDLSTSNKKVMIYDKNGKTLKFSDISAGNAISVLKSRDGKCIEVWVSDMTISDYVISEYYEDSLTDSITISNGEASYTIIGKSDIPSNEFSIARGTSAELTFDFQGNLIWIEETRSTDGVNKGLVTGFETKPGGYGEKEYYVRIFTQKGQMEVFNIDEKLSFNNTPCKTKDKENELANMVGEVILYKTIKDENTITSIVTALPFGVTDTDNRGWYHVSPKLDLYMEGSNVAGQTGATLNDKWNSYVNANGMNYWSSVGILGDFMFYNKSTTTVFTAPNTLADYGDIKKFSVSSPQFDGGVSAKNLLNAYSTDPDALAPEAIAFTGKAASGSVNNLDAFVITGVSTTINDELLPVKVLTGYQMNLNSTSMSEKKYYIDTNAAFKASVYEGAADLVPGNDGYAAVVKNNVTTYEVASIDLLAAGDVLRISADSEGYIKSLRVVYDESRNWEDVEKSDSGTYVDAGYPLYVSGDYVRIVRDLPHTVDLTDPTYVFSNNVISGKTLPKKILVAEKAGNKYVFRSGSIEDIVTYKDSGPLPNASDYNRVVLIRYCGELAGIVVFK